jgi:hypothetical protein
MRSGEQCQCDVISDTIDQNSVTTSSTERVHFHMATTDAEILTTKTRDQLRYQYRDGFW